MTITANNIQVPTNLYNLDFSDQKYNGFAPAYHDLQESVGMGHSINSNGISPNHFRKGWTIFSFQLTSDMENSDAFELIRSGTTNLCARFSKPIPAGGAVMIIYGEMDSLLKLDNDRNLTSDLTV